LPVLSIELRAPHGPIDPMLEIKFRRFMLCLRDLHSAPRTSTPLSPRVLLKNDDFNLRSVQVESPRP